MKSWARINQLFLIFTGILVIILLFAFVDFLLHSLSAEYAAPPRYFPNKILYGTIYGFALFLVIRKQRLFTSTGLFSRNRYFITGSIFHGRLSFWLCFPVLDTPFYRSFSNFLGYLQVYGYEEAYSGLTFLKNHLFEILSPFEELHFISFDNSRFPKHAAFSPPHSCISSQFQLEARHLHLCFLIEHQAFLDHPVH